MLRACGRDLAICVIGMVIAAPPSCALTGRLPGDHAVAVRAQILLGKAALLQAQAREDSSRRAITHYRQAARLYRQSGDSASEARAFTLAADAMLGVSNFPAAIAAFQEAIRLARSAQHLEAQFDAIDGLSHAYFELGEPAALSRVAKSVRDLSDTLGKPVPRAKALIASGRAHFLLSDDPAAFADFREALAICRAETQSACEADALEGIAWTFSDTGDLQAAIVNQESAMLLWRNLGNVRAATRAERMIATFHSWLGDREKALPVHHKTLRQFQRSGDRLWEGRALLDLAWEYLELDAALSSAYQLRALRIFHSIGHRAEQLSALADLCWNFRSAGQLDRALKACRERYSLARSLRDPRREAVAASQIGLIFQDMGDLRRAMRQYEVALQLSRKAADPRGQGDTLRYIGGIHLLQGQPKHALSILRLAAEMSDEGDDPAGEAAAWKDVGRAHAALGEFEPARRALERALVLAESLRETAGSPMMRAAYFASVQSYYEQYIDLLMRWHSRAPQDGFDVLAFEASERSRARSLLEFVASGASERTRDPAGDERLRLLQTQLEAKLRKLAALPAGDARRSALETDLREIQAEIDDLVAGSKLPPQAGSATSPRVARLRDIQENVLDDDTVLLQYALGKERGFLWIVGRHRFESYVLPGRARIERLVRRVRDLLVAPQPRAKDTREVYLHRIEFAGRAYWKPARELAEILLPAAKSLVAQRLLISADGLLEYIPFSGLPLPASSPSTRRDTLGKKYEVVTLPSASTIAALRSLPQAPLSARNIAIFADPVFESHDPRVEHHSQRNVRPHLNSPSEFQLILRSAGFAEGQGEVPRLPGTRREAEAILRIANSAHLSLGFAANLQAVTRADLTNYRILHFATHGVLHSEHPELSGIILSLVDKSGRPQEGYLRFHHVYNLKLAADLVVLSACSSALGRQMAGEGVLSLSRAFFVAGSKRVVSSLWKVDDEVTSELMSVFYDEMLRRGKAPSAALRAAQMEIAKRKRWNFPYYWAAFVLQGDWR